MEKFLESAAIAWNPIGEARRSLDAGTLNVTSVLAVYIGIVIACNLIALGGTKFFLRDIVFRGWPENAAPSVDG